jgi:PAS domain S-box-containing protein
MTDETGWIFWYNQRWYEFTGTTLAEMQGWGWQTVHHPDHVESVVEKISHCFQTGEVWEDTFPLRGRDGNYRWFLSRAIPIRDGDGRIVRWFGTNTDIDEQKRAEMALRVAQEQKEQFIASLAHDLKTPLTTIKGAAQLLARRADRSGTTEMTAGLPRLHAIDDAATRMVGMIDALLDAARARGGYALDLARSATDLVALARRAIAVSEERGTHRFHLRSAEPNVTGEWDAARLERVLENFLSNACKYSPEGSAITVTVAREGERGDEWAVLTVADAGIGIPATDVPHIFEQFYRAGNARDIQGAGVGLVGAKQIIEQHGGAIAITSEEGEGTTVTIRLPFAP